MGLTCTAADLRYDGLRVGAGHYAWWLGIYGMVAPTSPGRFTECFCADHVDPWACDVFTNATE